MSHVSLYRKYRPENFSQVLGQESIVQSLEAALKSGNISHAYLFSGSRGIGKTSVARIFARELGVSPNDIYEIDAASNNGVDEIRELRDGVSTLPFDSKYKVYILDEVHMLSKSAFNAFLKTLEEPPKHVIFILATTELHRVLDTVKSRCQVFEFKKPSIEILTGMIQEVVKKEGFSIDSESVEIIAKRGDGAFRDTLGMLERVMQSGGKKITVENVNQILSAPQHELVTDFTKSLIEKNATSALQIINDISENHSLDHFLERVLETFRIILLYRFSPDFAETIATDLAPDSRAQLKVWAGEKNVVDSKLLAEFIQLLGEVKKTSMPQIPVELAIMRILGQNTVL